LEAQQAQAVSMQQQHLSQPQQGSNMRDVIYASESRLQLELGRQQQQQQGSNMPDVIYASESRLQLELALQQQQHQQQHGSLPINYMGGAAMYPPSYYGGVYPVSQSMQQHSRGSYNGGYDNNNNGLVYAAPPAQLHHPPMYGGGGPSVPYPPTLEDLERAQMLHHQQYQSNLRNSGYPGISM
jgi:hypothetical protein